jgi:hypothetical protein
VRPNTYPLSPRSYLLENIGGRFRDATKQVSEALLRPGMVTDAHWHDLTGNGTPELILTGEWMPLRVFQPSGDGTFTEKTENLQLDQATGWWNALVITDLDDDGDADMVAGNRGWNAQYQAGPETPTSVYAGDFDQDGGIEPIMSHFIDGMEYPLPRRSQLTSALSMLRARFQTHEAYAEATMDQVLTDDQWKQAQRFPARTFTTSLFEQQEDGTFARHDLPVEAQFSPTHDIVLHDVNDDDRPDLLLAGNDFTVPEPWGPSDAGKGVLLMNQGNLTFDAQRPSESGFYAPGDVRALLLLPTPEAPLVVVGNNDAPLNLFEIRALSSDAMARASE